MRRTKPTRPKTNARNRRQDSASGNKMTGLGLFAPSSSSLSTSSSLSSSSNLSPLAVPFTVERSNPSKPSFDFNFNSQSSNPNPCFTASTSHSLSVIGPNQRVVDPPSSHNWCSMDSSVKSGLEHVNPPGGYLFGSNFNTQPRKWSFGNDGSDGGGSVVPLEFNLFGSSPVGYGQSLSGPKFSGQTDGSRGKEDSSLFGAVFRTPVTRENNIGPSIIGKSHGTSSPATCHGLVSSGFSNEHTFTWNGSTSHYPFETRSIFYDSSSDQLSPSMSTKSLDISSTSLLNKNNNVSVSHNPLIKKESYQSVGLICQAPDKNSTEDVNSAEHLSEHLDHHNPGEDSPCWKGAPTHFSSSGSQEQGSLRAFRQLQKQLEKYSGEDVPLHMDQSLHGTVKNAASVVTSESLDVNTVVKALDNLSELLLRLYSKDECALKEQDRKSLDHVIANLNVCRSSKLQQVDPAQKCPSPKHLTSNVLRGERNNDQFGKNIKELPSAYARDEGLPKDYNMVQKIKRVLDENLECNEDLPSDPLLYKNLWLEAEAELCVSSYKTRLHRAKREMSKSNSLDLSEVAADIKKISSSSYPPTAPEWLHEAAGRKTSSTHAPNLSTPVVEDIDDVEYSVMARYNILKHREGSNPVSMAEEESADVEASGNIVQSSGVAEEPYLKHLLDTDDAVMVHSHGNQKMQDSLATEDVDNAVMARLNILKSRGELDHVNAEHRVLVDGARVHVFEGGAERSMTQNQFGSSTFGWEYVLEG